MQVEYIIRYIYLPRPVSTQRSEFFGQVLSRLQALEDELRAQVRAELLENLQRALKRVAAIANQIKSPGIQRMLENAASEILDLAASGNPEAAVAAAEKLVTKALDAQAQVHHIKANIAALKNPISVQGKAAALLRKIADAADAAVNAATSMEQLADLTQLTDKARGLMEAVKGMSPTSRDYGAIVAELGGVLSSLDQQRKDTPGMARDALAWSREEGQRVSDAVQQLRDRTRDAFTLEKLDQLDLALADVMEAAQHLDPASSSGPLRAQLDGFLKQAAAGELDEALEGARKLAATLNQAGRLRTTMEGRLERLAGATEGLADQPKARVERVLEGLREALGRAQTPAEMQRLDKLLQETLEAASTLRAEGKGAGLRHPAYLKLLQAEQGLGEYLPQPARAPKLQGDTLLTGQRPGSGRLPPRVGTQPLPPAGTGRLPDPVLERARLEKALEDALRSHPEADARRIRAAANGEQAGDLPPMSRELQDLVGALQANRAVDVTRPVIRVKPV